MDINEIYLKMLNRTVCHSEPQLIIEEPQNFLFDFLLTESIFHVPWKLKEKVKRMMKDNINKLILSKNDLLTIIDKEWEHYENLKKLNEEFVLKFLYCKKNEFYQLSGIDCILQGHMCEVSENPEKEEIVWIDSEHDFSDDEHFSELLKHELGHVWTFAFGFSDEDFKTGQTIGQKYGSCKITTKRQLDILKAFYNEKIDLLKQDFNYVLTATPGNEFAYEFTSIVDEIIELLTNDYLEMHELDNDLTPQMYFYNLIQKLSEIRYNDYSTLNFVKHYFGNDGRGLKYKNFNNLAHIRNDVRRLFLIWEFGNEKQKNILINEIKKEFI